MKKISFIWLFSILSIVLHANIHYVTSTGDHKTSPAPGMLRYHISNCSSGDTIRFSVDSVGLDTTIRISYKKVTIDGGNGVIIDVKNIGRVFNISADNNSPVVLKGLIIQHGNGLNYGGGLYLFMTGNVVSVENCTFRYNTVTSTSDAQGGGLRTNGGTFKNCRFLNNKALCSTSVCGGGGVFAVGGTFINCIFAVNSAKYGGGIYASGTVITNCTFTQNVAETAGLGGGISSEGGCVINNSIIYNNRANNIENNIDDLGGTVSYCAMEAANSRVGSNGNIGLSATPFVHTGADSLSLKDGNSCINAGNSSVANLPDKDIKGSSRIFGSAVDLGAYEVIVPVVIGGNVKYEYNTPINDFTLCPGVVTNLSADYEITSGENGIEIGDTLVFIPPSGYAFHPGKIIVGNKDTTINIIAYKGIVVEESTYASDSVLWNADTVNIFCDLLLDSTKLKINPGTKIKFHGYYGIRVSGTGSVYAQANADLPIIFTAADSTGRTISAYNTLGAWNRITFENMSPDADSSCFEFCTIEYSKGISPYGTLGGAVFINTFNKVLFSHCKFYKNMSVPKNGMSGSNGGGAVRIEKSDISFINCSFLDNYNRGDGSNIWGGGAAIYCTEGSLLVLNCIFLNNLTFGGSGGAVCSYSSNINIYNSLLRDNTDYYGKNSISGSTFNIYNCNLEGGNTIFASVYENCIDLDPKFNDAANGDYSFQANSPCINAGTLVNLDSLMPGIDLYGNARIYQNLVDMGVLEYQSDIPLVITGTFKKENGVPLADFNYYAGYNTNDLGEFTLPVDGINISIGDTIRFNNPAGYEIYPSRIFIDWDEPRVVYPVAYQGIVIDKYVTFDRNIYWETDFVNVFTDINVNKFKLSVKEGTHVRFHAYSGINVTGAGSIQAIGTSADTIFFSYAHPELSDPASSKILNCWKGIRFSLVNDYADSSFFNYCKIEYAKTENEGGGVFVSGFDRIKFNNCVIRYNSGIYGGGLHIENADIEINNTIISQNVDGNYGGWGPVLGGGGLYLDHSDSKIMGCVFAKNTATWSGLGMLLRNSNPDIINCSFYNDVVMNWDKGESIYMYESVPRIYNSIFYGSSAIQIESYASDTISRNTSIVNSCIKGGNSISAKVYENCIDSNPMFTDAAHFDFSLQNNSPCINKGTYSLPVSIPEFDITGNLRIMGDTIDMGAFEHKEITLIARAGDAVVDVPVQFKAEVIMGTAGSWSWDFNSDGTNDSDVQNPAYAFADTGTYTVRLIAYINEWTQNDTIILHVKVYSPVQADFSVSDSVGSVPLYVNFTDKSLNHPTSWYWDFGDGNHSTLQNPQHKYFDKGEYTVTLISINDASRDTLTKINLVRISDGYLMKNGTYYADSGYFYDDGGFYNNYSQNLKDTLTFYPSAGKRAMAFDFELSELYYNDILKVYDGSSISAPLIATFKNTNYIKNLVASNEEGAITFVFISGDYWPIYRGWSAKISTLPVFDVIMESDEHGYLVGDSLQLITRGKSSVAVSAMAAEGYHFVQWQNSAGDSVTNTNPLVVANVTSDTQLIAVFEINTYNVVYTASENGYITGETEQLIIHGEDAESVSAVANNHYHFVQWENAAGDSVTSNNPFVLTNITQDIMLTAVFEKNTYLVAFSTTGNGHINGDTSQTVKFGENALMVTVVPDENYHFLHWQNADGSLTDESNPLLVSNVVCDTLLIAVFSRNPNSLNDFRTNNVILYPNPVKDVLNIESRDISRIEVFSSSGELIDRVDITNELSTLNMSEYPRGVYLLKLIGSHWTGIEKVIKE